MADIHIRAMVSPAVAASKVPTRQRPAAQAVVDFATNVIDLKVV